MTENNVSSQFEKNKELINLSYVFNLYFRWKWLVIISVLISFVYNVNKLRSAEYLYEVSMQVIAVTTFENNQFNTSRNSIANFLGVSSSQSNSNFSLYRSLVSSKIMAEKLTKNNEFLKVLLGSSWDEKNQVILSGPINFSTKVRNSIKKTLGIPVFYGKVEPKEYIHGFLKSIAIIPQDNPNFLELKMETSSPKEGVFLLSTIHNETDTLLKERNLLRATNNLDFIKSKLSKVQQEDQRQTLISALSSQQNAIMSSSTDLPFVAEAFGSPSVSMNPVSPKPKLTLAFSIIFGLVFGLFVSPVLDFYFLYRKLKS